MSESLTDFILARIAEDEGWAKAAQGWQTGSRHEGQPLDWSIHMDRWSPDRVLAECAAKRRIVEEHVLDAGLEDAEPGCRICSEVSHYDGGRYSTGWPCETLAALASVYADHRDYDPAWRDADD